MGKYATDTKCFVLFAKNCTNQIKSNYLNSHGEEAQEKPRLIGRLNMRLMTNLSGNVGG